MEIGIEWERFLLTFGLLLVFGILYANFVLWLRRRSYEEGYTSLLVVWGVIVTISINKMIHHPEPLIDLTLELACFVASGLPMIIMDVGDHVQQRAKEQQSLIDESEGVNDATT